MIEAVTMVSLNFTQTADFLGDFGGLIPQFIKGEPHFVPVSSPVKTAITI